ncbi:MAG: DUF433 domain-containing protein [Fimbriimonadaceae bacterium]|nr:DUF433 domain-containing protein [Fimbriimonadaceae bacterium]
MNYREYIEIQPGKHSGKPCFKGTRITVQDVFDYLGGGMTPEELLRDFPDLTPIHVKAAFACAADRPNTTR